MYVGRVQQIIEPVERLQREQGHISPVGYKSFEPRTESSIAAENEMNPRVVGEGLGQRSQQFEALLRAHVARVEQNDLGVDVRNLGSKFTTKWIAAGGGLVEGIDRVDID